MAKEIFLPFVSYCPLASGHSSNSLDQKDTILPASSQIKEKKKYMLLCNDIWLLKKVNKYNIIKPWIIVLLTHSKSIPWRYLSNSCITTIYQELIHNPELFWLMFFSSLESQFLIQNSLTYYHDKYLPKSRSWLCFTLIVQQKIMKW